MFKLIERLYTIYTPLVGYFDRVELKNKRFVIHCLVPT